MARKTAFKIAVPAPVLKHIRNRVAQYKFLPEAKGHGWALGTSTAYLKKLCAYWLKSYDWRKAERGLNRFPQFRVPVDVAGEAVPLHFVHVKGKGPNPVPLLLTHGWPGSFFEFLHVVEPLTDPARFGGDARDSFDIVVPSLPGYGFSGKPSKPIGPNATARAFHRLMHDILGYDRYIAQGGDWGSIVTCQMALVAPERLLGIHLNMMGLGMVPNAPLATDEERTFFAEMAARQQGMGAYAMIQATKPETLGFALSDSPVGTLAWIVEKFHAWSDLKNGDLESRYTKDQLLTNAMIYIVTDSIKTSTWMYNGFYAEGGPTLPPGTTITVPTAIANFPGDFFIRWPPRPYVERTFANIVRWTDMPAGGHFAALEEPRLFVDDVRAFARPLRP